MRRNIYFVPEHYVIPVCNSVTWLAVQVTAAVHVSLCLCLCNRVTSDVVDTNVALQIYSRYFAENQELYLSVCFQTDKKNAFYKTESYRHKWYLF